MKIRTLIIIYFVALATGAVYKYVLFLIQPETFSHINSAILELTIVSAIVTAGVAIFYMFRRKRMMEDEN